MGEYTHAEMHGDHQHWLNDGAMWSDDIGLWKDEAWKALADLVRLEAPLNRLAASIQAREEAVNQHIQKVRAHEHSVAEFERTGKGDALQLLALAKAHKAEAADHARQREIHERLKREHYAIMAHWNLLLRELTPLPK
jgi:hypothetical protein